MELTVAEIAAMAGGELLSGSPQTEISHFITNSKEASPGVMFVPVRGERVDGHNYISAAFAGGASASFTDHPLDAAGPLVLVEDCRAALQRTTAVYRQRFDIPVVGITGSVGKTTAKEMIAQGLSATFSVHKTPGNANSQVGVPITMCGLGPEHTAAVVEMGVSMPGEMERIARVVRPTCGVVTTIGTSHIEFMKTRENIMAEKAHMADYLPQDAPLFVNGDNDLLSGLDPQGRFQLVAFGLGENCRYRAVDLTENDGGTVFTCLTPNGSQRVKLPAVGEHNVRNALAALAVGEYLGQSLDMTAQALAGYIPPAMRQQISEIRGMALIDDSYNASPDSMRSALEVLAGRQVSGKRVAVLAGMLELGEYSRQGHLETGRFAQEKGIDTLIAIGELGETIAEGYGPAARLVRDNAEAISLLKGLLRPGDAVLVKGSRGMHTEEIVQALALDKKGETP